MSRTAADLFYELIELDVGRDIPRVFIAENEPLVRVAANAAVQNAISSYHDPLTPTTDVALRQLNQLTGNYEPNYLRIRQILRNQGTAPRSSE